MELHQLENAASHHHEMEVRVVRNTLSHIYQIECETLSGDRQKLSRRGKPCLFRSIDEAIDQLMVAGIRHAWIVRQSEEDGSDSSRRLVQLGSLPELAIAI
ncbi:hypothetical protein [Kushneria marisflavi]|uniref:Uncharacterized protein n=1 Tax=Kushneria marisflavi TaxID=157779 RepID=A0A240UME0_9GAMM|nr:hypothetical protein [Kushneria marisflavi]ART62190.1 hypothetical protein B9H00_03100 [Kushneria marisflavi]RKD87273.1 hypothetical protein C8D96_0733 [Kushneria marisflavi]